MTADPEDDVLDVEFDDSTNHNHDEENHMALNPEVASLLTQQLSQLGIAAASNFTTVSKAADYSYLQGKDMVSLTEAMGAREVGSKVTPGGPAPA
jgi:hypothetical protein